MAVSFSQQLMMREDLLNLIEAVVDQGLVGLIGDGKRETMDDLYRRIQNGDTEAEELLFTANPEVLKEERELAERLVVEPDGLDLGANLLGDNGEKAAGELPGDEGVPSDSGLVEGEVPDGGAEVESGGEAEGAGIFGGEGSLSAAGTAGGELSSEWRLVDLGGVQVTEDLGPRNKSGENKSGLVQVRSGGPVVGRFKRVQ